MIELGLLCLASFLNVVLGLVVFMKNPKSITNKLFLILTSSFALWSTVNYISVHPIIFPQIIWVRLVLFFASFLCLAVYLTFKIFPSYNLVGSKFWRRSAIGATAFVMFMTQTPYVFKLDSKGEPTPGFAIAFFAIVSIGLLTSGVVNLVIKYRRASGRERDQFRIVLAGIGGSMGLIFLTNFLFVVLFGFTGLIPFGPTFTLLFSGSLAYAIIKHRLFDIRAATARGLAYLLSFGTVGLIYGVFVLGLSTIINQHDSLTLTQRGSYIAFAMLTALVFPRTKAFFDRITNRFFFRDAYDPQSFLDDLNAVLVHNIDLETLLTDTADVFVKDLKTEFASFYLYKTSYSPVRLIGKGGAHLSTDGVAKIVEPLSTSRDKVVVADYLEQRHGVLRTALSDNDSAAVVKLQARVGNKNEVIGMILFGAKKSGNPYNKMDIKMFEIISNELVIAIQNALRFEEIEQFNITLQQKVDDATYKLRKTNEKLRQMDETKDDFISMASHQLRTPLTSVKGYVSMVLDEDAGKISPQQRKLLDQAFISSQRMVYLIADLLNVSRLKTGKFIIDAKPTNLADIVETELDQLKETAKGRGLKLEYQHPKNFPSLNLDETKIRQVIMNFSDNAIYYTPSGGTITVELVDKADSIELTVSDNGIGVPKSEQHHLFTKFYRADNAKKARPDGTGLGLFMAQKVIVAQGGALIFHSEENKGSTFGFSFPKAKLLVK
ncbi:MAG: ATP-binding protein [Candidatus Saccharimonadales bacterium]